MSQESKMPNERQWFIPGEGIDRHVITADIQSYLGNDATVRPGDHLGVPGYWIKAYRTLTAAMIADLRADSRRLRQEQRATGTRGPFAEPGVYPGYVRQGEYSVPHAMEAVVSPSSAHGPKDSSVTTSFPYPVSTGARGHQGATGPASSFDQYARSNYAYPCPATTTVMVPAPYASQRKNGLQNRVYERPQFPPPNSSLIGRAQYSPPDHYGSAHRMGRGAYNESFAQQMSSEFSGMRLPAFGVPSLKLSDARADKRRADYFRDRDRVAVLDEPSRPYNQDFRSTEPRNHRSQQDTLPDFISPPSSSARRQKLGQHLAGSNDRDVHQASVRPLGSQSVEEDRSRHLDLLQRFKRSRQSFDGAAGRSQSMPPALAPYTDEHGTTLQDLEASDCRPRQHGNDGTPIGFAGSSNRSQKRGVSGAFGSNDQLNESIDGDGNDDGPTRKRQKSNYLGSNAGNRSNDLPCMYAFRNPEQFSEHATLYPHISKLQLHLQSKHEFFACPDCLIKFDDETSLALHTHDKACWRTACRRQIPRGTMLIGPCDCLENNRSWKRWLGLYRLAFPNDHFPAQLQYEFTSFPKLFRDLQVNIMPSFNDNNSSVELSTDVFSTYNNASFPGMLVKPTAHLHPPFDYNYLGNRQKPVPCYDGSSSSWKDPTQSETQLKSLWTENQSLKNELDAERRTAAELRQDAQLLKKDVRIAELQFQQCQRTLAIVWERFKDSGNSETEPNGVLASLINGAFNDALKRSPSKPVEKEPECPQRPGQDKSLMSPMLSIMGSQNGWNSNDDADHENIFGYTNAS